MNSHRIKSKLEQLTSSMKAMKNTSESFLKSEQSEIEFLGKILKDLQTFTTTLKFHHKRSMKRRKRVDSHSPQTQRELKSQRSSIQGLRSQKYPTFKDLKVKMNEMPCSVMIEEKINLKRLSSINLVNDPIPSIKETPELKRISVERNKKRPKKNFKKKKKRKTFVKREKSKEKKICKSINPGSVEKLMKEIKSREKLSSKLRSCERSKERKVKKKFTIMTGKLHKFLTSQASNKEDISTWEDSMLKKKKRSKSRGGGLSMKKKIGMKFFQSPAGSGSGGGKERYKSESFTSYDFEKKLKFVNSFDIEKFKKKILTNNEMFDYDEKLDSSLNLGNIGDKILFIDMAKKPMTKLEMRKIQLNEISEELDRLDMNLDHGILGEGD